MDLNGLLQAIGVVIALAICVGWILRRIRRRNNPDDCHQASGSCSGCRLKDHCNNDRHQ